MSQKNDFSFGSKLWNEYYHGRNKDGHRPASDRAKRYRERARKAATAKALRDWDQHRNDELKAEQESRAEDLSIFDWWPVGCGYRTCG